MLLNIGHRKELHVFVSFSTNAFDIFLNLVTRRDTWPLMFCVLNFDFKYRFRASNEIILAFVPGSHDSEFFETFVHPIIENLKKLREGIEMQSWDVLKRKVYCPLIFSTYDFPACSKVCASTGHNALKSCRYCEKISVNKFMLPLGIKIIKMMRSRQRGMIFDGWILNVQTEDPTNQFRWRVMSLTGRYKALMQATTSSEGHRDKTSTNHLKFVVSILCYIQTSRRYEPSVMGCLQNFDWTFFGVHPKSGSFCSFIICNCCTVDVENALDVCATGFPSE